MPSAKDIVLKPISSALARETIKRLHYSGKVVQNSTLHIGVYLGGRLEGAMQFGPSLDKRKLIGLVEGTQWDEFIELNRMAFSDALPRNSESRALAVAFRLLRRHAPQVKWVVSFSDGTQSGDGTIYRAAGFVLTGITSSGNLARLPDGQVIHKMTLESNPTRPRPELGGRAYNDVTGGRYDFAAYVRATNATVLQGYQLRYIYLMDQSLRSRLTVPVIPFDMIDELGAGMYLGERVTRASRSANAASSRVEDPGAQPGDGGANPTTPLHNSPTVATDG